MKGMASKKGFLAPEHLSFTGNVSENWKKFNQRFELFAIATLPDDITSKQKTAALLTAAGEEAITVYNNFVFTDDAHKWDFTRVCTKFSEYCNPKKNNVFERYQFWEHQKGSQSYDQFVTELKRRAEDCDFHDNEKTKLIRDKLIFSITDIELKKKLLAIDDLSLDKALELTRIHEASSQEASAMFNLNVQKIHNKIKKPHNFKNNNNRTCSRCGGEFSHQTCPAMGSKCHECGKLNHWATMCRSSKKKKQHFVRQTAQEPQSQNDDVINPQKSFLGRVEGKKSAPWTTHIHVHGRKIFCQLDTGADVTVFPDFFLKENPQVDKPTQKLYGPGGKEIPVVGLIRKLPINMGQNQIQEDVYFIQGLTIPLLSRDACEGLGLIKKLFALTKTSLSSGKEEGNLKEAVLQKYPELFQGLGKVKTKPIQIQLTPDAIPHIEKCPRRIPLPLMKATKEEIDRMISSGVIEKVEESTEWCSGLVVVPRKNNQVRLCVDLSPLNKCPT